MSLKAFHIVFIIVSTLLCAVMVAWGWNEYDATRNGLGLLIGLTGAAGLALLVPYYGWFRKKMRTLGSFAVLFAILLPGAAEACSVCFGDPSSPMVKGLKVGILMLLFVITSILVAIAAIGFTWSRRAKALPHP